MSTRPLLRIDVPARAEALADVRAALSQALDAQGVSGREAARIVLAVDEACANIIRHAYRGCADGRIRIHLERCRGALRIRLRDGAPPVDPKRVKIRDLGDCRPGGLGVNFIDATMDRWRLRPLKHNNGNILTMVRKVQPRKHDEQGR